MTNQALAYLTPALVHALASWNPLARTAVLPNGTKVREMTESTSDRVWYVAVPAKKSGKQLSDEISEILTTPEEDFGAKRRGGKEPA